TAGALLVHEREHLLRQRGLVAVVRLERVAVGVADVPEARPDLARRGRARAAAGAARRRRGAAPAAAAAAARGLERTGERDREARRPARARDHHPSAPPRRSWVVAAPDSLRKPETSTDLRPSRCAKGHPRERKRVEVSQDNGEPGTGNREPGTGNRREPGTLTARVRPPSPV